MAILDAYGKLRAVFGNTKQLCPTQGTEHFLHVLLRTGGILGIEHQYIQALYVYDGSGQFASLLATLDNADEYARLDQLCLVAAVPLGDDIRAQIVERFPLARVLSTRDDRRAPKSRTPWTDDSD